MKKRMAITLFMVLCLAASVHAMEKQGPVLTFATQGHDFGTIYFDKVEIQTFDIKFANTGNSPLLLENVRACCGTVVTHWTREPVLPGETGTISIRFRVTNRPAIIRRVVSVTSNSLDNPRQRFQLTGQIQQSPE